MKKQLNEVHRMQKLAGLLKERSYDQLGQAIADELSNRLDSEAAVNAAMDWLQSTSDENRAEVESLYSMNPSQVRRGAAEAVDFIIKQMEAEAGGDDDTWIDPAGGTHYGDEDDPAAMYKEVEDGEIDQNRTFDGPIDIKRISNVDFEGIDYSDYPDFVDAYIVSADYDGEPMSDSMIEEIPSDIVYDLLMKYLY